MAFVKRTWLARIGIGLNKFLIGDRDSQGKQTLVNDPDSISQAGDVISADNLNDLENRIDNAFSGVETAISDMKLEEVWTNPNPTSSYVPSDIPADLITSHEFLIDFIADTNANPYMIEVEHVYFAVSFIGTAYTKSKVLFSSNTMIVVSREIVADMEHDRFIVGDAVKAVVAQTGDWSSQIDNSYLVPNAIYRVGDIIRT